MLHDIGGLWVPEGEMELQRGTFGCGEIKLWYYAMMLMPRSHRIEMMLL